MKLVSAFLWIVLHWLSMGQVQLDQPLLDEPIEQTLQRDGVRLHLRLDRSSARIAEPIELQVEFEAPPGTSVTLPDPELVLASWSVLEFEPRLDLPMDNDRRRWQWTVLIESLSTGTQTIPSIEVAFRLPNQDDVQQIRSEAIRVSVASVLEADEVPTEPRDIKGPTDVPLAPSPTDASWKWWSLAGFAGLLAVIIVAWLFHSRKPQQDSIALANEQVAAIESALDQQTISLAECYEHLSMTLRALIQSEWGLPAVSASSEELLSLLETTSELRAETAATVHRLRSFLETADQIRFGMQSDGNKSEVQAFEEARVLIRVLGDPAAFVSAEEAS